MTRVGLVLGAGGVVGQAYHAGVLAALEHDLGWDPRTADVVVGSSAGSVVASLLRLGVPASDLAAWTVDSPLSREGAPVLERVGDRDIEFPSLGLRDVFRLWRLPRPALVARVARRPWALRPTVAAMTLLPAGRIDLLEQAANLNVLADRPWPEGLRLCAVRRDHGRRIVFGQPGKPEVPLPLAIAASCAIPGYFSPVTISGREYIDGGCHSANNVDVLRREELDLVIVVSPMSSARRQRTVDGGIRWRHHRQLMAEVKQLQAAGTRVVRIEPRRRSLAVMGVNAMSNERTERVVPEAFLDTGRLLTRPKIAEMLAPLAGGQARRRERDTA